MVDKVVLLNDGCILLYCSRELGPLPPPVGESEFDDIMNRNRAISSSAISKAVSGASAGKCSCLMLSFPS